MPLLQTTTAAGGGGVLRNKRRMAVVGRLFSVSRRVLGRQSLIDECSGMQQNRLHAAVLEIAAFPVGQTKAATERRARQSGKDLIQRSHVECVPTGVRDAECAP
jgi:hypothetical protein